MNDMMGAFPEFGPNARIDQVAIRPRDPVFLEVELLKQQALREVQDKEFAQRMEKMAKRNDELTYLLAIARRKIRNLRTSVRGLQAAVNERNRLLQLPRKEPSTFPISGKTAEFTLIDDPRTPCSLPKNVSAPRINIKIRPTPFDTIEFDAPVSNEEALKNFRKLQGL